MPGAYIAAFEGWSLRLKQKFLAGEWGGGEPRMAWHGTLRWHEEVGIIVTSGVLCGMIASRVVSVERK